MADKFSRIGFILAVAGSAVGLGNAWKFPTMVGNNGGSAFIALYLLLTFAIAFIAFLAELAIGRLGETDLVGCFYKLAPKHKRAWSLAGFFSISAILIASFYMVVIGWLVYYIFLSFTGLPATPEASGASFERIISADATSALICFSFVFVIVFFTVSKGIKSGIERLNVFMMPSLFILLCVLFAYSLSMGGGFLKAAEFLFVPDFSKITPHLVLEALGLAFFSLSMGTGTIPTYAASLDERTNLVRSTLSIIFINILIGIMMGLIVFTFIFDAGFDSTQGGPGLIFVSLALLFAKLGVVGQVLAVCFFTALLFAGVTSAVSMIEPFAFYLINKFNITRKSALLIIGVVVYVLGIFCVFSFYKPTSESFSLFGKPIFDILDALTSTLLMPLGALSFSIFVGYVLKKDTLWGLFSGFMSRVGFNVWYFALRYIVPLGIVAIMLYKFKS
ncbi:sodium-dependent transporter [Campylobacter sp. 19-13652]|uniref:sodium-dependent transporter n=1 Tax=Campylobacter sp. 19-13652 TaxID=2840180 RepID=UPI001C8622F5|nr:sodium-dependent transporter [Campylobacter sp. 19-13652]